MKIAKTSSNSVREVCIFTNKVAILCGRCADFKMEAGGGGGRREVGLGGEEVEVWNWKFGGCGNVEAKV